MGGTGGVVDAGAMSGVGGVVGSTWGAAEVVGVTRGTVVVGEAGDGGAVWGWAVGPLGVAVGPPACVLGRSDRLGSRSDCLPLFRARSDRPGAQFDRQRWEPRGNAMCR
jgi:hypothetical protein